MYIYIYIYIYICISRQISITTTIYHTRSMVVKPLQDNCSMSTCPVDHYVLLTFLSFMDHAIPLRLTLVTTKAPMTLTIVRRIPGLLRSGICVSLFHNIVPGVNFCLNTHCVTVNNQTVVLLASHSSSDAVPCFQNKQLVCADCVSSKGPKAS